MRSSFSDSRADILNKRPEMACALQTLVAAISVCLGSSSKLNSETEMCDNKELKIRERLYNAFNASRFKKGFLLGFVFLYL